MGVNVADACATAVDLAKYRPLFPPTSALCPNYCNHAHNSPFKVRCGVPYPACELSGRMLRYPRALQGPPVAFPDAPCIKLGKLLCAGNGFLAHCGSSLPLHAPCAQWLTCPPSPLCTWPQAPEPSKSARQWHVDVVAGVPGAPVMTEGIVFRTFRRIQIPCLAFVKIFRPLSFSFSCGLLGKGKWEVSSHV